MLALAALTFPLTAMARDVVGQFDYYVLALSWQPAWCTETGDDRDAPECATGTGKGFTVHGLWPQYDRGWPQDCRSPHPDPSRRATAGMTDIMGSAGLAWYQWQKHGRCFGLSAGQYFDATRAALDQIRIPDTLARLPRDVTLPPRVIEEAFQEANPALHPDGITVTCKGRAISELRICLTRDLAPRTCAPDTRRDCDLSRVLMEAVR